MKGIVDVFVGLGHVSTILPEMVGPVFAELCGCAFSIGKTHTFVVPMKVWNLVARHFRRAFAMEPLFFWMPPPDSWNLVAMDCCHCVSRFPRHSGTLGQCSIAIVEFSCFVSVLVAVGGGICLNLIKMSSIGPPN